MGSASIFTRLPETEASRVTIFYRDEPVTARDGDTVAAALLAAGYAVLRTTPVGSAPRGPFCLMGACFECLVEIDGAPNRQACQVLVRDGMRVHPMAGARAIGGASER